MSVNKRLTIINDVMTPGYDPPMSELGTKESTCKGHWNRALKKYKTGFHDPNWVYMYCVDENSLPFACVIYDRYPKAFVHLLVLPMTIDVDKPEQFEKRHLCDLTNIHRLARTIANELQKRHDLPDFLIGYHALPSMNDLHLHIVSGDLVSPYLKRKEHFHSFTNPDYFVTPNKVETDLKKFGMVQLSSKVSLQYVLKASMVCHQCRKRFTRVSDMKNHLTDHVIQFD